MIRLLYIYGHLIDIWELFHFILLIGNFNFKFFPLHRIINGRIKIETELIVKVLFLKKTITRYFNEILK